MLPRPNFASASRLFIRPSHLVGDVMLPVDPHAIALRKQHAANTIATFVCRMTCTRAGSLPSPVAAHSSFAISLRSHFATGTVLAVVTEVLRLTAERRRWSPK